MPSRPTRLKPAWPLDEGLIDYTAGSYGSESDENPLYTAKLIANRTLSVGGRDVWGSLRFHIVSTDGLMKSVGFLNVPKCQHQHRKVEPPKQFQCVRHGARRQAVTEFPGQHALKIVNFADSIAGDQQS